MPPNKAKSIFIILTSNIKFMIERMQNQLIYPYHKMC